MESVLYSFMITLLHSVWQSALLLLLYIGFDKMFGVSSPLLKRNLLYSVLGWQLLLSIATFFILHCNLLPFYVVTIASMVGSGSVQHWMQSYAVLLMSVYCLVLLYKVVVALRQRHLLYSFYNQQLQKASVELRLFTNKKAYQFGIVHKVEIWLSDRVHTPLTFGFWKPIILLPIALVNQLSTAETEALIIHELTHIKAKDYLLNWLLMGAEALYFFNPFVSIIAQKIRLEREKHCDIQVLQFEYSNIVYAESLLKTAQFKQEKLALQLAAFQNRPQLLQRIQFFTDPQNLPSSPASQRRNIIAFWMIPLLVIGMLWISNIRWAARSIPSLAEVAIKDNVVPSSYNNELLAFSAAAIDDDALVNNVNDHTTFTAKETTTATNLQQKKRSGKIIIDEEENLLSVSSENQPIQAISVSNIETIEQEEKQIVINEETSSGKKITTAYRVIEIDGQFYLEPLWMVKDEPKPIKDSLLSKSIPTKKDSVIVLIPTVQ